MVTDRDGESNCAGHRVRHELQDSPDPHHVSQKLVFEPGNHPYRWSVQGSGL